MQPYQKAFTLIELLIALAIVGIIAAIAVPSYQNTIRKSNRAEAKTELVEAAQRLQRCYTLYAKFDDATNCSIYSALKTKYMTGGGAYYQMSIGVAATGDDASTTYKLTATAKKAPQTKDTTACQTLTLDHKGARLPAACW